ncbi:hypothetical protein D3C75_1255330 [compost metagenome]
MVAAFTKPGSASGNSTLVMICIGVAPMARAASTRPDGISNSAFSTIRAIKGAAPTVSGTIAACKPIEVPTIMRVNGIIQTSKMMNGMERKMFTNPDNTL